jgi:hypothetical protein
MKSIVTSIAASSLLAALAIAQPPRYTVTDLGTLGGTSTPHLFSADATSNLTRAEMEVFLRTAAILKHKELGTGVTHSIRATLSDGKIQHDAHIQQIDESKTTFQTDRGTELNFRDSWKFNIAAYRLDQILDLNMTPMSVERSALGKQSAITWWLDGTIMEIDRKKKRLEPTNQDSWNRQMYVVRVFDQLIYNTDRKLQNLMIDAKEWRIWMIDHTRAFRMRTDLQEVKNLVKCDRKLLAGLRKLDLAALQELKPYVTDQEIKGLLARRDKIVKFFDNAIAAKGEAAVLYDLPQR